MVSIELVKMIMHNEDALREIKTESEDIFKALCNVMVAMDKQYGGLDLTAEKIEMMLMSAGVSGTGQGGGQITAEMFSDARGSYTADKFRKPENPPRVGRVSLLPNFEPSKDFKEKSAYTDELVDSFTTPLLSFQDLFSWEYIKYIQQSRNNSLRFTLSDAYKYLQTEKDKFINAKVQGLFQLFLDDNNYNYDSSFWRNGDAEYFQQPIFDFWDRTIIGSGMGRNDFEMYYFNADYWSNPNAFTNIVSTRQQLELKVGDLPYRLQQLVQIEFIWQNTKMADLTYLKEKPLYAVLDFTKTRQGADFWGKVSDGDYEDFTLYYFKYLQYYPSDIQDAYGGVKRIKMPTPTPTPPPTPPTPPAPTGKGITLPKSMDFRDESLFPNGLPTQADDYLETTDTEGNTRYFLRLGYWNPDLIGVKGKGGLRPSPSRSASSEKLGAFGVGNDGEIYEVQADKKGTQTWRKSKKYGKMGTIEAFISAIGNGDITDTIDMSTANSIARYTLAKTDRGDDDYLDIQRDVIRLKETTKKNNKYGTYF